MNTVTLCFQLKVILTKLISSESNSSISVIYDDKLSETKVFPLSAFWIIKFSLLSKFAKASYYSGDDPLYYNLYVKINQRP